MKNLISFFVFITLIVTVWQVQASDWGSRLQSEHTWLVNSLTPEPVAAPQVELVEDSISTGQAAPQRNVEEEIQLSNPWDLRNNNEQSFKPSRKRSR
tara:strand:+ start:2795 stop:3085 length:291 start_codon:yes stop_codon:yes gene_type:complete